MSKINDELKRAICQMPSTEKDKILLRLIAKDEMLIAKMQYQLLEDENDVVKRRDESLEGIKNI